jgi:hypothetical protein|tara:strand:+ start:262 stop:594 length:333 start_codon:yes stop_codon:yes gene_type:complete
MKTTKGKQMRKKTKKRKARPIKHIRKDVVKMYKDMDRESKGTVYMFHNTVLNIMLFVNCKDADEAAAIFDSCGFINRDHWKIFLEMGQQPTDGPNDEQNSDDTRKGCVYH